MENVLNSDKSNAGKKTSNHIEQLELNALIVQQLKREIQELKNEYVNSTNDKDAISRFGKQ